MLRVLGIDGELPLGVVEHSFETGIPAARLRQRDPALDELQRALYVLADEGRSERRGRGNRLGGRRPEEQVV